MSFQPGPAVSTLSPTVLGADSRAGAARAMARCGASNGAASPRLRSMAPSRVDARGAAGSGAGAAGSEDAGGAGEGRDGAGEGGGAGGGGAASSREAGSGEGVASAAAVAALWARFFAFFCFFLAARLALRLILRCASSRSSSSRSMTEALGGSHASSSTSIWSSSSEAAWAILGCASDGGARCGSSLARAASPAGAGGDEVGPSPSSRSIDETASLAAAAPASRLPGASSGASPSATLDGDGAPHARCGTSRSMGTPPPMGGDEVARSSTTERSSSAASESGGASVGRRGVWVAS